MNKSYEYTKRYRADNPEKLAGYLRSYRARYPEKDRAHAMVSMSIHRGKIKRQNCFVCDSPKAHAHHEDYSRPLDLIWYCRRHHAARHREIDANK